MFPAPGTIGLHRLNGPERTWPETNCYMDLWIGLLHAAGRDPLPLMGAAAGMAWEGDHFTFIKPSAGDLFALAGIVLQELPLWDGMEGHVATQVARGAVPMPEVDGRFLEDCGRLGTKTSIGIVAIDRGGRTLDYVHNGGLHRVSGDDYAGVLCLPPHETPLVPYCELARFSAHQPADVRAAARGVLAQNVAMRGEGNPVLGFAAALPGLMEGRGEKVHLLCFNTARQLGSGFGLLADHLVWLGADPGPAVRLSDQAKTFQFQMARATRRGRWDAALGTGLEEMAASWAAVDAVVAGVCS